MGCNIFSCKPPGTLIACLALSSLCLPIVVAIFPILIGMVNRVRATRFCVWQPNDAIDRVQSQIFY